MKYALYYPDAAGFMQLCHKILLKSILMETRDTRQINRTLYSHEEGKSYLGKEEILLFSTTGDYLL